MTMTATSPQASMQKHVWVVLSMAALLFLGVGGWAISYPLAGAVLASGRIVVESHAKPVQHPTGGKIAAVLVRNGEPVKKGQVLVQMDKVSSQANLTVVVAKLNELQARLARLDAEIAGEKHLLREAASAHPEMETHLLAEAQILQSRQSAHRGKKELLGQRLLQLEKQLEGLLAQQQAKIEDVRFLSEDVAAGENLFKEAVLSSAELRARQRALSAAKGQLGALVAEEGRMRQQMVEVQLQSNQLESELLQELTEQRQAVRNQIEEFDERRVAAEQALDWAEITAPQDGVVHELQVYSAGEVLSAGQVLAKIIPLHDEMVVEVQARPQDVDQIFVGQRAQLSFSAFDTGALPQIFGVVQQVGVDLSIDDITGVPFYLVRIEVPKEEMEKLAAVTLVPGMPVEAFIETPSRTAFSYATKPILAQINRAFKE